MVDSLAKVLTFFVVVVLVILLLNLGGDYVTAHIPAASGVIRQTLEEIWNALQRIVQAGYQH